MTAAAVRRSIAGRTIFNLLGPLANPAAVTRQLIGIARPDYVMLYAEALSLLGVERAMMVSGMEGLDELSISGPSQVALIDGQIREAMVSPADAALASHPLKALLGGDAASHPAALVRLLDGEAGAYRDAVLLNAAGALIVAEKVDEWSDGVARAAEAIDSGAARRLLPKWIAFR